MWRFLLSHLLFCFLAKVSKLSVPMLIQCPECQSRYRASNYRPDQPAVRIKCPKCAHVFVFSASAGAAEERSVAPPAPAVLVVDDARFFRDILTELLAPLAVELVSVGTAADALRELRRRPFQLVLVDLNLPDMSGQELMRKIRSDHALGRLKVLAMSGAYRRADCEADALASGADAFLNKSFKPEELQQRIRDLLGL
jgi:predicted Zn finger-like uncharacterized protein